MTWFNYDGELIKDFKIDLEVLSQDFLLFSNNTYYFFSRDWIITNEKPLVVNQPHRLFALTQNGKEISELIEFPVKMYMLSSQYRAVWRPKHLHFRDLLRVLGTYMFCPPVDPLILSSVN